MRRQANMLKTTVTGGLFVLMPVTLVVFVLVQVFQLALSLVEPMASFFPNAEGDVDWGAYVLTVLVVLGICLFFGVLAQTRLGRSAGLWVEETLLSPLPVYKTIKGLTRSFRGEYETTGRFQPAMIRSHENIYDFGFIVDEFPEDYYAMFIPMAPIPNVGNIVFVPTDRVEKLDITLAEAVDKVMMWGIGTRSWGTRIDRRDEDAARGPG